MVVFDAVGELAAQPGGEELSALADRVQRVDPEVLRAVGRGLGTMAEGVDGSLAALGRHGEEVRAAWSGRGAEAFGEYVGDLRRAGRTTLEATGRIRERVAGAGQVLDGLRREVDGHVTRALDAARRARAEALADPARAPLADQLAARALAEPTAAARAALARAETDLGDTATLLQQLAADACSFSRMPSPDALAIGASGWAPAPTGGSVSTVPALSGGAQGVDVTGGADSTFDLAEVGSTNDEVRSGGESEGCSDEGTGTGDALESEASGGGGASGSATADEPDEPGAADNDVSAGDRSDGSVDTGNAADQDADADAEDDDAEEADAEEADAEKADAEEADAEEDDGAVTGASTDAAVDPDASDGAAPTGGPPGQVGDWIREAMAVLQAEGVPRDEMDPDDIATIIEHESGGDPEATNDWDSNAAKGTPSQGLMQTIGPTFDSYKLAGHDDIKDPVDNIIAGVRYAIDRYGSVSQVPGVEAVARGDAYVGY